MSTAESAFARDWMQTVPQELCARAFEKHRDYHHRLRILVLEAEAAGPSDAYEEQCADLLLHKLQSLGHWVEVCHSEAEALGLVRTKLANLEFVDVVMLRREGWDLTKYCQSRLPVRLQPEFIMYCDDDVIDRDNEDIFDRCLRHHINYFLRPSSAPLQLVQVLMECRGKTPDAIRQRRHSSGNASIAASSIDSGIGDEDPDSAQWMAADDWGCC